MAQTSWPFEAVDTTETQYSRLLRHIGQGVVGIPGDNNLLVFGDSSGMNVKVKVVNSLSAAIVRGHMYQSTAQETLTVQASESNPRIDTVVLTLDPSVNTIVLAVVKGTAAVSPVAPTLTQTDSAVYQLRLANVSVPASATTISAGNVTDLRTFIGNVWTSSARPTDATLGKTGWNTSTAKFEVFNGTTWTNVVTGLDASDVATGTFTTAQIPDLSATKITSGTLDSARLPTVPVSAGGTGSTTLTGYVKGAGTSAMSASSTVPGSDISGTVAIGNGGTGSTTAGDARTALGVAPTVHTHTASQITDPANIVAGKIYAGGTSGGYATRIYVQAGTPTGMASGDLWFW